MSSVDLAEAKTPLLNKTDKTNDDHKYPQLDKPNDTSQPLAKVDSKKQYVKILNASMKHNKFQYVEGLNVDIHPFNPTGECQKGGLYFCELSDVYLYLGYGTLIADVEIPSDAKVYQEKNKLKADKIILKNIRPFGEHKIWNDIEFCEKAVNKYANYIGYAKAQTPDMCVFAVALSPSNIKYVKHQTPEMGMYAIGSNPHLLQCITDQTPDMCKMAVMKDGMVIQYIKNQTPELCKLAINQNSDSIRYIKDQTPELCKLAVSVDSSSIRHIKNQTPELCKLAVENEAINILYIKEQTEEVCWIALNADFKLYRFIKNPTDEMKKCYNSQHRCVVM
jgi:hypothetical protein